MCGSQTVVAICSLQLLYLNDSLADHTQCSLNMPHTAVGQIRETSARRRPPTAADPNGPGFCCPRVVWSDDEDDCVLISSEIYDDVCVTTARTDAAIQSPGKRSLKQGACDNLSCHVPTSLTLFNITQGSVT